MLNTKTPSNLDSYAEEEDDDDNDTLSFRDLPLVDDDDQEINKSSIIKKPRSLSSHEDPFEFFNNLLFQDSTPTTPRVIISKPKEAEQETIVRLSASSSSNSSRRNSNSYYTNNNSSGPFSSISNVEKVNMTSLTSMSSKSRRIMFMFGPVKFNNEMELSSIKMRQSKRAHHVSLAALGVSRPGELAIVCTEEPKTKWGLLKSLSRYTSRATRDSPPSSCGCFS